MLAASTHGVILSNELEEDGVFVKLSWIHLSNVLSYHINIVPQASVNTSYTEGTRVQLVMPVSYNIQYNVTLHITYPCGVVFSDTIIVHYYRKYNHVDTYICTFSWPSNY